MAAMAEAIDFEAEGLLDGLEGDERESRLALLERLAADGADSRSCAAPSRRDGWRCCRSSACSPGEPEVHRSRRSASAAGVPIDVLERQWRSLGLAIRRSRRGRC